MDRTELLEFLKDGISLVSFKRIDGSTREMRCTLDEKYLVTPLADGINDGKTVTVWDIEKSAWRSFFPAAIVHKSKAL